jgi:chemotaxis protein MotA
MDLASIIGIVGAFAMLVMSIFTSGGSISSIVDLPSFLMVVIGSYFALLLSTSLSKGLGIWSIISRAFKIPVFNEQGIITRMKAFSEKARREGLLALEDELEDLDDEFMKMGLRLVVDGTDAEVIRSIMELELSQMQNRHADRISQVSTWSALAPGFGMLGTVIGLIGMLKNLDDKASIGPNMALALVTTLYGSMVANIILIPITNKLKSHDAKESTIREMVIEGVLSIQAGDNTRILAMKLMAYLNPDERRSVESELSKD